MADYLKELLEKAKKAKAERQEEKKESIFDRVQKKEEPKEMPPPTKNPISPEEAVKQAKEAEKKPEPKKPESENLVSTIEEQVKGLRRIELDHYGEVEIFRVQGQLMPYYFVPVPRPTGNERAVINTLKEATTRLISIAPYKIRDPIQKRNVYYQKVLEIMRASPELRIPSGRYEFYANAVIKEMVGYGLIDALIQDDQLEEIMVLGAKLPVYVFHRKYEMMLTNIEFFSEDEIQDLVNRIAREIGRRVDIISPLLDARLPDGSRVNATIPPASVRGSTLTIRKFRTDPYSMVDLINLGTLDTYSAGFLWLTVEGLGTKPANTLIAGGTGSGKTTLLNVLASFIPPNERIVSIEDTAELSLPMQHWIRLEARPPGLEGTGEITLDILTKNSLRMRPDRIIVGEVRHAEAFTLFTAINTGHDGCLGTLHSNSPQETVVRIESPPMNVPQVMLSGLDLIVMEHRLHDRRKGTIRRVTNIAELTGVLEGKPETHDIFLRDPVKDKLVRTNVKSIYLDRLSMLTGLSLKAIESEILDREKFFKKLVEKNIRSLNEGSRAAQLYLEEKRNG